ncbi:transcriptional regulator [Herbaspirillum sp. CF444]|uniref:LysR family transcriptional regulator n=1 Tax=Herbaspirillum sp. CF444 TaxID=1144319 RepID=UPI000272586B|nr:LysR family transcriptional regulator [Herbaspirillum sp. CF444]EJL80863.1 transcriptional regulator [Herbaspirillum sp. CF444]
MADLNDIAIFVKVAQFESFSRAAHALGMPVSTVSRRVSELEQQLGVTLLQRTTRKLTLTVQGLDYFHQCQEPLNILADAERVLTQTQKKPEGILRVTVPVVLREQAFLNFVSDFLKNYPRIRIDLFITNEFINFVERNVDVGIRFGDLEDSSLIAKKLGANVRYLVATPSYLEGRPLPARPEDLRAHQCVLMNGKNVEARWDLVNGKKQVSVEVSGAISSRDFNSVSYFTHNGHGIGLLPFNYCNDMLADGRLQRVLPQWSSPKIPVHALYPTRKFLPARLRVFLEALEAWDSPFWNK